MPLALIIWKDTIHFLYVLRLRALAHKPIRAADAACVRIGRRARAVTANPMTFICTDDKWPWHGPVRAGSRWKSISLALHLITQHMLEITPKRIWGTLVDPQHEKASFSFCFILFNSVCANHWCGGRAGAAESVFNLLGLADESLPAPREVWISHSR